MKRISLFAAVALAAGMSLSSTATAEPTAQSNLVDNGINLNGAVFNGINLNGIVINGFALNGWHPNGLSINGLHFNGKRLNGFALNGHYFNGFRVNEVTPQAAATNPFLGLDQAPLGQ